MGVVEGMLRSGVVERVRLRVGSGGAGGGSMVDGNCGFELGGVVGWI